MREVYYETCVKNGKKVFGTEIKCEGSNLDFNEVHSVRISLPDGSILADYNSYEITDEVINGVRHTGFIVTEHSFGTGEICKLKSRNFFMKNCKIEVE